MWLDRPSPTHTNPKKAIQTSSPVRRWRKRVISSKGKGVERSVTTVVVVVMEDYHFGTGSGSGGKILIFGYGCPARNCTRSKATWNGILQATGH